MIVCAGTRSADLRPRVQVIVNANASRIDSVRSTLRDASLALDGAGARTSGVVTRKVSELREALADSQDRRVVLVGGDGAVHAAANAGATGELGLLPAGRANNIAHALGLPLSWPGAAAIAVREPARPIDVLAVETRDRRLLAVEGVSAGFQAAARSHYTAESSGALGSGVIALLRALATHRPYEVELLVDGEALSQRTSQVFVSNLPLFGFGFRVAPGALPDDGVADLTILPPVSRGGIPAQLARVRRGAHLSDSRVVSRPAIQVELRSDLPLVADAEVLGDEQATVRVVPNALGLVRAAPGHHPTRAALPGHPGGGRR